MAHFDIISATTNAYKTAWHERRYIARLIAGPMLIKLVCFIFAASFAKGDGMFLRFTLIMLPAYLAEGWALAHFTRLLVMDHRWPFRATGNRELDLAMLSERARGVLSGMIVFILINMGLGLLNAVVERYFMAYVTADGATVDAANIPPAVIVFMFLLLGFMLWGFRLLWLYIPFALNQSALKYLQALRGIMSSIHMIAIWLICSVPFFLVMRLVTGIVAVPVDATFGDSASSFIMAIMTVVFDTLKNLLATAGITYGLIQLFSKIKDTRS